MQLPDYVPVDEVKRVCKALGLSDWTAKTQAQVSDHDARVILDQVNGEGMPIVLEDFRAGLEVELEHGTRFKDANVTNNHPVLTGMIVLAHMKETLDYYQRVDVAEAEGDLLKAVLAKDLPKIEAKYRKLVEAQTALNRAVAQQLP